MKTGTLALLIVLGAGGAVLNAQEPPPNRPTEMQLQGLRLFRQRCYVCHAPSVTVNSSATYGPRLSKMNVEGKEQDARRVIADGSPRMPGFVYSLDAREIDAIIAYLKTVEKPVDIERVGESR